MNGQHLIVHSARAVDAAGAGDGSGARGGAGTAEHWAVMRNGRLTARGVGEGWRSHVGAGGRRAETGSGPDADEGTGAGVTRGARVVDAEGAFLTFGFLDQHCHGGAGVGFERDQGPAPALALHRSHGTTRLIASLVTDEPLATERAARRLAASTEPELGLLGIHLEGPFLAPSRRGAHPARLLRPPRLGDVQRLYDACEGRLLQLTLAPELDAGLAVTRWLVAKGVRVAVGHSDATREQALAAFDAGASVLTHAFNAMPGLHHREPGPLGAALDRAHVSLELVADGLHVAPTLMRLLFAAAPWRVALVSDAMAAAGQPDGDYRLGGADIRVSDGVARVRDEGAIAGSTLTLATAVRRCVAEGIAVADVVRAATLTPALAMGAPAWPAVGEPAEVWLVDDEGRSRRA